jgi:hypothetical protein
VEPAGANYPSSLPHDLIRIAEEEGRHISQIKHVLILKDLPVDIRHNAKINRELLTAWAATKLPELA